MTGAQRDLKSFLGSKNFKGLYTRNPLARAPDYHKFDKRKAFLTSYPIKPQHFKDRTNVDWQSVFTDQNATESRQPFPENTFTRPNKLVGPKLREALVEGHAAGSSVQQLSFKYKLSVPRVDAILKLDEVRKRSEKLLAGPQKYLSKDIAKMAKSITSLFDEIPTSEDGTPRGIVDNLTEIPMPKETRKQMFQSIAESEPFGPVDAAEVLGIEPAKLTLEKLTDVESGEGVDNSKKKIFGKSFFAKQIEGERHLFRFTDASVGRVGYHYGAARDDQKSGRRVKHSPDGRKTYPSPEHS